MGLRYCRVRWIGVAWRGEPPLQVLRYVERNALSAGLVQRAEQWRWGSLWAREHGEEQLRGCCIAGRRRVRAVDRMGE